MIAPAGTLLPTQVLDVDGVRVRRHVSGVGHDVVLLHGVPETLQSWRGHVQVLSAHWRVHVFDWPGLGASDAPRESAPGVDGYARFLSRLLDVSGVHCAHLVATDISVPTALLFALDHAPRVRTLTVFDGPVFPGRSRRSLGYAALRARPLGDLLVHALPRTLLWLAVHGGLSDRLRVHPDVWEDYHVQARRSVCRDSVLQVLRTLDTSLEHLVPRLNGLRVPMQILWGEDDAIDEVATAALLAQACPQARLHLAPQCGHALAAEAPEFLIDRLVELLSAHDAVYGC